MQVGARRYRHNMGEAFGRKTMREAAGWKIRGRWDQQGTQASRGSQTFLFFLTGQFSKQTCTSRFLIVLPKPGELSRRGAGKSAARHQQRSYEVASQLRMAMRTSPRPALRSWQPATTLGIRIKSGRTARGLQSDGRWKDPVFGSDADVHGIR